MYVMSTITLYVLCLYMNISFAFYFIFLKRYWAVPPSNFEEEEGAMELDGGPSGGLLLRSYALVI
jgi:hypothetical protein